MYPDVTTYTGQLRKLEAYVRANPESAHARFVLAYQYLCEGHDENAVAQLKQVVKLQPGDTLSAQLVAQYQPAGGASRPAAPPRPPRRASRASWPASGSATPAKGAKIALAIQDDGRFAWTTSGPGKPATTIAGTSTLADGVLTLADQGGQNGALAGNVVWQDADHFNFRLVRRTAGRPGAELRPLNLDGARSSGRGAESVGCRSVPLPRSEWSIGYVLPRKVPGPGRRGGRVPSGRHREIRDERRVLRRVERPGCFGVLLWGCPVGHSRVRSDHEGRNARGYRPAAAAASGRPPVPLAPGDGADLPDRDEPGRGRPAPDRGGHRLPRPLGHPARPARRGPAGVLAGVHPAVDQHPDDRDPGRRGRPRLHDRREQGHQAHAAPDGGRALALRQQDAPGLAEDAAVPLATGPRGEPGERKRRRAGRLPVAVRDVPHVHRRLQEGRPRRGRQLPGPDRRPRPGPTDRGQGAGGQAQGGPRPVHLRDLPGPPGLLGRHPAGGPGPQGGADHGGEAGRGRAQGAMALQPGHGPVAGPALRGLRVEAHRPRAGGDRAQGRGTRVRARARPVAPSPGPRRAQVSGQPRGSVLAGRVSDPRGGPARPARRPGVPARRRGAGPSASGP